MEPAPVPDLDGMRAKTEAIGALLAAIAARDPEAAEAARARLRELTAA